MNGMDAEQLGKCVTAANAVPNPNTLLSPIPNLSKDQCWEYCDLQGTRVTACEYDSKFYL